MKYLLILALALSPACALAAQINTSLWGVEKSEYFIVYYQDSPLEQIKKIISVSEKYYRDTAEELGFARYENFWTWEKRARIYVFKDAKEYSRVSGQPKWSAAGVNVYKREIQLYPDMEFLYDTILPHEIGHIVFREFVGFNKTLPLWLDEGIACYLERKQRRERFVIAQIMVKSSNPLTIMELSKTKREAIVMPGVFYAASASIIEFLLRAYGKDKFFDFCQRLSQLRPDQTWMVALEDTYHIESLEEMNCKWSKFMLNYKE